jgi:membrane protease YdiL (CAAX protease family)
MTNPTPAERAAILRSLRWYIALAFLPTVLLGAAAAGAGGPGAFPAAMVAMLIPGLAAIVVQKWVAKAPVLRGGALGLRIGAKRWWLLAPAGIGLLAVLAFALTFALAPATLAAPGQAAANLARLQFPESLGTGGQIALLVVLAAVVGPIVNLPLALGAEIGWRGFMTPRFTALYGRAGLLLAGLIWALWHTPLILLGYNYPDHPGLGHLVWIPSCIAMSILLQAAYAASRSIFVPALAYGMLNQLAGAGMALLVVAPAWIDWLHGPAGLIGLLVTAVPAAWIFARRPDLLLGPREALGPAEGGAAAASG